MLHLMGGLPKGYRYGTVSLATTVLYVLLYMLHVGTYVKYFLNRISDPMRGLKSKNARVRLNKQSKCW